MERGRAVERGQNYRVGENADARASLQNGSQRMVAESPSSKGEQGMPVSRTVVDVLASGAQNKQRRHAQYLQTVRQHALRADA